MRELWRIADGRADLLAQAAGVLDGFYRPEDLRRPHAVIAAGLLVEAGADRAQLEQWRVEGAKRRAVPLPGTVRSPDEPASPA